MAKMIFVNLPVAGLPASVAFYEGIGAMREPRFSNEQAACMVISETIHLMLLTHDFFRTFTAKTIVDARGAAEVLICLGEDSREAVDATLAKAAAAGARLDPTPAQDMGFMYGRSFEDPDGHIFELMWMDVAGFEAMQAGRTRGEAG